jgi:NAD(P)H-dependent FMN reductase
LFIIVLNPDFKAGNNELTMPKNTLLIITHTPSPNTLVLSDAIIRGALSQAEDVLEVKRMSPFDAIPDDVLHARGIILGTTENFGYMAGATKDFFDRCYYDLIDRADALPYAVYIRAGLDGTGATNAISRICKGLKWKQVQPPLVLQGKYQPGYERECEALGAAMAAGLGAGIF